MKELEARLAELEKKYEELEKRTWDLMRGDAQSFMVNHWHIEQVERRLTEQGL